jgi:NAD(P)-dependent dehydrogenase (short-subunit alcohol dehydrogenase family)
MITLKEKVALVTGSARRLGKAMAMGLAAQGMHQVIHHSNSDEAAAETAEAMRQLGVETVIVKADLSQPDQINMLFAKIRDRFGRLDVLVNSSSTFERASVRDLSLADWQHTLDVNLTAPFLCSQHAIKLMPDGGAIVNMVDISAFHPLKAQPQHSVSKAGLLALTKVMALSFGPTIRVNAIAPGAVLRPDSSTPESWQKFGARLPLQRTGSADDVVQALIYLVTQEFTTGTVIHVDGGEILM